MIRVVATGDHAAGADYEAQTPAARSVAD